MDKPESNPQTGPQAATAPGERRPRLRTAGQVWEEIRRRGWRENLLRFGSHAGLILVIVLGVWAVRRGLSALPDRTSETAAAAGAEPTPVAEQLLSLADLPAFAAGGPVTYFGIERQTDVHTVVPSRPRLEIVKYLVQKGDTLFGIAEKFNLKPESILWGNWVELDGDPHTLQPGQELSILPIDGALHLWSAGESLEGVATFFRVSPTDILEWPGNALDLDIDIANPGIPEGTALVIPDGKRDAPTWKSPRITRANPASASILGAGACSAVSDGPIGTGSFAWPTSSTWVSGYNYNPGVHPAIDLGGSVGNGIFAADSGVVVYSGWNDWGYGYVIVIDHGNGWQSLYAHLSTINSGCGQAVFQGQVIGGMGCTGNCSGPHLHFELMNDSYGKVNPLDFLP
ncbi:MAG: M23 family metallopeptidase [Anaerolineales bacterium]|nr:M23 family metallopeptidase [Anaerolineales bacterium]